MRNMEQEDVEIDAKVFSYAPRIFKFIRAIDGVSEYEIMMSVRPSNNKLQIFKSNQNQKHSSGGKSNSFFFFTEDK